MSYIRKFIFIVIAFFTVNSYAQLTISGELRPRAEYRNGYKTLTPDNTDAALFVGQRTRLNTLFSADDYSFFLSLQDVRVWGDVPQLNLSDKNGITIHEAWGLIKFSPNFAAKLGRQELVYDDHRMFGNVGWAQQARSHDAAVFKFGNENYKFDIGFAYNQEQENLFGNLYTLSGNYKAMQYAWYNRKFSKFTASFLFLNNGMQNITQEEIKYSQTFGTHLNFKLAENLKVATNAYVQSGKDVADNDLSAYLVGADLSYKASSNWNFGLGFEIQSGNDNATIGSKNKAFTPFYGTNHKFNGHMDYFYVGNHINNVGLVDVYASAKANLSEKSSLTGVIHNFSGQAELPGGVDKQLGTELDFIYNYKFNQDIAIGAGFSTMIASEGLEVIKGNNDGNSNTWGWLMITIKPTLFTSK